MYLLQAKGSSVVPYAHPTRQTKDNKILSDFYASFAIQTKNHYFYDMEKFRKLTPHDLAFGIGRKATDEELRELVTRPKTGKRKSAQEVLDEVTKRLANKDIKKAS